jgi:hypothetical protein
MSIEAGLAFFRRRGHADIAIRGQRRHKVANHEGGWQRRVALQVDNDRAISPSTTSAAARRSMPLRQLSRGHHHLAAKRLDDFCNAAVIGGN